MADAVARPVSKVPARGKLLLVDSIELHNGGCALNTGIASARLGLATGLASCVGDDPLGDFLLKRMRDEDLDAAGVMRHPRIQTSATAVLVSPDGERSFIHVLGASRAITGRVAPDRLLQRYRAVHVGGFFLMPKFDGPPARRLLQRASRLGRITSLDTCWDPKKRWHLLKPCLRHVDYYMPSVEEAAEVFKRSNPEAIARAAFREGVRKMVILKLGARGCFALPRGGSPIRVPAFRVRAVDTVGAGDAFDAGFLLGVLRGWPPEKSLRLGNAAGALCVSGPGAVGRIESLEQARKLARI